MASDQHELLSENPISARIYSIDMLRGIVMVLMALDHLRDFFTPTPFLPEDVSQTTPGFFIARWITHFCAPVFVFLAGTGVYLYATSSRKPSRDRLTFFLLTRGVWLIFLELALFSWLWMLELWLIIDQFFLILQVIWVIGVSMIVLAGVIRFHILAVLAFGLLLVGLHNLLDPVNIVDPPATRLFWEDIFLVLHGDRTTFLLIGGEHLGWTVGVSVIYPLLPWPGVMALGYAFGWVVRRGPRARHIWFAAVGVGATALFVLLRWMNGYGDPHPWVEQEERGALYTIFSFLNCEKYPPSLCFLLMTLGPAILVLPLLEILRGPVQRFFLLYGRVPMFYYILHLAVIHCLAVAYAVMNGWQPGWWWLIGGAPKDYTPRVWVAYAAWIVVVLALWPLCAWYAGVKRAHPDWWWLRYV